MLVAAAVCPHPPLLLPGVAAGATSEADTLRSVLGQAVQQLCAVQPDLLVVVGTAPEIGPWPPDARGSLAPYGVDLVVGRGAADPSLPLSLTVGLWVTEQHAPDLPRLLFGVHPDTQAARCADLGAGLAQRADRVALLVMGDGSARRSLKGPGYLDDRAEDFDASVATAFARADAQALLDIDPGLATELLVAGRGAWQVLAGAALARTAADAAAWTGEVSYVEAPYGVGYLVATWSATRN